ncbi:MAG: hypothetical protein CMP23_13135 [Rickettsiales bacterium]|nr:hypothetical protein [Rickettsiales bacterium]
MLDGEGTVESYCIRHPGRQAQLACARCGDFICSSCVVSGDLCPLCRTRLFREGVAYGSQEQARAAARRCRKLAERCLSGSLLTGGSAVVLQLGIFYGWLPRLLGIGVVAAALSSVIAGLLAVGFALRGHRASGEGKPGVALAEVFPLGYALGFSIIGVLPFLLGLFAIARLFRS